MFATCHPEYLRRNFATLKFAPCYRARQGRALTTPRYVSYHPACVGKQSTPTRGVEELPNETAAHANLVLVDAVLCVPLGEVQGGPEEVVAAARFELADQ